MYTMVNGKMTSAMERGLVSKPHGQGTHTFSNGNIYEGEFKSGIRHGKGKFTTIEKDMYSIHEGEWKDDRMHGKQKITLIHKGGKI